MGDAVKRCRDDEDVARIWDVGCPRDLWRRPGNFGSGIGEMTGGRCVGLCVRNVVVTL